MRSGIPFAMLMATLVSTTLGAQQPHFGVGLNLTIPTGSFSSNTYSTSNGVEKEEYDLGMGAQFSVSFPVDPQLALRLELSGQSVRGDNTAVGFEKIYLRHQLFSIAGEMQVFLGSGSAVRHKGTYLLGGLSADFERFERSFSDSFNDYNNDGYYDRNEVDTERKNRMGLLVGLGHSFGYNSGGRFTLEAVYHKTLTGHDFSNGEPVSADFLRLGFGWVF